MSQNILIVEDDICLAYAIQSYIASQDRKIFIVNDSLVAIELLYLYSFDLVLSDISMPKINGYQLLSIIRLNVRLSIIPVIFLTAKGMTKDRVKAYQLGCTGYLTKPFHPAELIAILDSFSTISDHMTIISPFNFSSNLTLVNLLKAANKRLILTRREKSVLILLVRGMMNKEIAQMLNLSLRNVEKYVSRLLFKIDARNRTELVQMLITDWEGE